MLMIIVLSIIGQSAPSADHFDRSLAQTLFNPLDETFQSQITNGGSGIVIPAPNYAKQLSADLNEPITIDLREPEIDHPHYLRADEHYDCDSLITRCPPPSQNHHPSQAWPDYRDSSSYFGFEKGYLTTHPTSANEQAWIDSHNFSGMWWRRHQHLISVIQPVLAFRPGTIFIINHAQKPFFNIQIRLCPSCVSFTSLDKMNGPMQGSVNLKIAFMKKNGIIPEKCSYDTVLTYRKPQVWNEQAPLQELGDIVFDETKIYADRLLKLGAPERIIRVTYNQTVLKMASWVQMKFTEKWLLNPHQLQYAKMVGPDPEQQENDNHANAKFTIPLNVLLRYVEVINGARILPDVKFLASIKHYLDRIGETFQSFWEKNHWIPGDRSVQDQIMDPMKVRNTETFDAIKSRHGIDNPKASPSDLYWQEQLHVIEDDQSANKRMDAFLGVENDYEDPIQLLNNKRGLNSCALGSSLQLMEKYHKEQAETILNGVQP